MKVIETTLATDLRASSSKHPVLERLVRAAIPAASPDFEGRYRSVRKWWIEVDDEGVPQRELGFNTTEEVVVAGPIGRNIGFWTDSAMNFKTGEYEPISAEAFEAEWSRLELRSGRLSPSQWLTRAAIWFVSSLVPFQLYHLLRANAL